MGERIPNIASTSSVAMAPEVSFMPIDGPPSRVASPDTYELAPAVTEPFSVPASIAATSASEETERANAALRVARKLIDLAAAEQEYEIKVRALGHAGAIFARYGTPEETYRVQQLMVAAANAAGRPDDAAFSRALEAMGDGNADAVAAELEAIPDAYDGRDILTGFVESRRSLDRMVPSFAAAAALAQAAIARMEETETSFLGWIFRTDYSETKARYAAAIDGWRARLESGRFASSREIVEDIWKSDPQARRGLALLAGNYDVLPEHAADALMKRWGDHVTLGDIFAQEESPDPTAFAARLDRIAVNADADGMSEVAAVSMALREAPVLAPAMERVIKTNFEDRSKPVIVRDVLKGALEPANVATMLGGFFLARLTTSAAMAKLATKGAGGISLGARAGSVIIETGIESGAFTFYQRALASAITTNRVDWSARGFARDWATLALSFGFLRASNLPLANLRRRMAARSFFAPKGAVMIPVGGRLVPALNGVGKSAFAVAENLTQAVAFFAGAQTGFELKVAEAPASFFEQWLTLLEFQLGVRMANRASHGWVDRAALKLRTEPVTDATSLIARKLSGAQPEISSALTQRILAAHVRGDLSLRNLSRLQRLFEKRDAKAIDLILEANAFLEKAHIDLAFDGERLFAAGPSARRKVVAQLKAEERQGKKVLDAGGNLIASLPGNAASVKRAVGIGAPDPGVVALAFFDPGRGLSAVLQLPADATIAEKADAIDALLTKLVLEEGAKVDNLRSTVATGGGQYAFVTDIIALSGHFDFPFEGTETRFDPRRVSCDAKTGKLSETSFDLVEQSPEVDRIPSPRLTETVAGGGKADAKAWKPPLSKTMFELNEITKRTPFGEIQNNLMALNEAREAERGETQYVPSSLLLLGSGGSELKEQVNEWFGVEVIVHLRRPSEFSSSMKKSGNDFMGFYDRIVAVDALRSLTPEEQLAVVGLLADALVSGGELLVTIPADPKTPELEALARGDGEGLVTLDKAGFAVVATPRTDDSGQVSDVHIVKVGENPARLDDLLTEAIGKGTTRGNESGR